MGLPEGEKGLLAGVVRTGDAIEINLNLCGGTALSDGLRQTACPLAHEFSSQDDLCSIAQVKNRGL
jgi:hypothetical protein